MAQNSGRENLVLAFLHPLSMLSSIQGLTWRSKFGCTMWDSKELKQELPQMSKTF